MTPFDRLEDLARTKYGSLSKLAQEAGFSTGYFYTYKKRGSDLGEKALNQLKERLGINPEYIKSGEGEPLLNNADTTLTKINISTPYADKDNLIDKIYNDTKTSDTSYRYLKLLLKDSQKNIIKRFESICNTFYINVDTFLEYTKLTEEEMYDFFQSLDPYKNSDAYKALVSHNIRIEVLLLGKTIAKDNRGFITLSKGTIENKIQAIGNLYYGGIDNLNRFLDFIGNNKLKSLEKIGFYLNEIDFSKSLSPDLPIELFGFNTPSMLYHLKAKRVSFCTIPLFKNEDELIYTPITTTATIKLPSYFSNSTGISKSLIAFKSIDDLEEAGIKRGEIVIVDQTTSPIINDYYVIIYKSKIRVAMLKLDGIKTFLELGDEIIDSLIGIETLGIVDSIIDTSGERRVKSLTIVEEYVE
ncbi:MAG: hypothetical protein Kapaf2KO_23840 [Candidatus Kapaibacteriales bacterium]